MLHQNTTTNYDTCSPPIRNPCPGLKSLLPQFETSLCRFEIHVSICNFFASILNPLSDPYWNPSSLDLQSLKPAPFCNPLIAPSSNP